MRATCYPSLSDAAVLVPASQHILVQYLSSRAYEQEMGYDDVAPASTDRDSAIYYCRQLQQTLQEHDDVKPWNWTP